MNIDEIEIELRAALAGRHGDFELVVVAARELDGDLRATLQAVRYADGEVRDIAEEDVWLVERAGALEPDDLALRIEALGSAFRAAVGGVSDSSTLPSGLLAAALPQPPPPRPVSDAATAILERLDARAQTYEFPMLDNGYVYPARARLTAYRSETDWALVIETFGYSPRAGTPSTSVQTYGSNLRVRATRADFASDDAWESACVEQRTYQFHGAHPIDDSTWPAESPSGPIALTVRGAAVTVPGPDELADFHDQFTPVGAPYEAQVARYLAAHDSAEVLANDAERGLAVGGLPAILTLDEWCHPDLLAGELPSTVDAFRCLAEVLATGDAAHYEAQDAPNTHWRFWPHGGSL